MLCFLCSYLAKMFPDFIKFPEMKLDVKLSREVCSGFKVLLNRVQVLPLSMMFVAMIAFNNLCLKYVGVSFYYGRTRR